MAEITAALVKELRERTGSGMMECKKALQEAGGDIEELLALPLEGEHSVDQVRQDLIAKIGENIQVRRFSVITTTQGVLNSYLHHGGRIGAVVELQGGAHHGFRYCPHCGEHLRGSNEA